MALSTKKIVLDTSAYSHFRRGDTRVADALAEAEMAFVPTIVLGELEAGFALGNRARENRAVLAQFLGEVFVQIAPVSAAVAEHYGRIFAELRRAGTPIPSNDIWIAAVAADLGGHLITFDSDFSAIAGISATILA